MNMNGIEGVLGRLYMYTHCMIINRSVKYTATFQSVLMVKKKFASRN